MRSLPAITPGDSLGDYTIGPELGRGGIAVVHEATHKTVRGQTSLAIKVANRTSPQRDLRFVREFERTSGKDSECRYRAFVVFVATKSFSWADYPQPSR